MSAFLFYNKHKGVIPLNDILKAALQAKYGEELKSVIPLSAEYTEEWEACKRKYADKIAIIKYMLDR